MRTIFQALRYACILFLQHQIFCSGLDIQYDLDLTNFNDREHYIEGINHIRIINTLDQPLTELFFRNNSNASSTSKTKNASRTEIGKVRCSHLGKIAGSNSSVMKVGLFPAVQPGETVIIDIPFKTIFTKLESRFAPNAGTNNDTTIYNLNAFYPVLEYIYPDGWHPDSYGASSWVQTNFSSYDISITISDEYIIGASAHLVKKKSNKKGFHTYYFHDDYTQSFTAVVSKQLQKTTTNISGIPIEILTTDEQKKNAKAVIQKLEELIPFYEVYFGKSLMDKLVITVGYNTGAIVVTSSNFIMFKDRIDSGSLLYHELAHQWFGLSILADDQIDSWLNESFAEYASWLFLESQKDNLEPFKFTIPVPTFNILDDIKKLKMEEWMRLFRDIMGEKALPPVYQPGKTMRWENSTNIYSKYQVGSYALQMLQASVGDSIMKNILNEYSVKNMGKPVSTETFIHGIKNYTDEQTAHNFRLALTTNIRPDLKIDEVKSQYNKNRTWTNVIHTSFDGEWILPADVMLVTEKNDTILIKQVNLHQNNEIKWITDSPVKSAEIDPFKRLFDSNRFNNRWPWQFTMQPVYGLPDWETYKVYYRPKIKQDWRGQWRTGIKVSGGLGVNLMPILPAFYQNLFDIEITFSNETSLYNWGGKINYRTPLKTTNNTYWEIETGLEYPKMWQKISLVNYIGEPTYYIVQGRSYYSKLTTELSRTEYIDADTSSWWTRGRNMKLKEEWTLFSYSSNARYLIQIHALGGFEDDTTFYNFGFSMDFETHTINPFIIRFHSEAGFIWDDRVSNELSYRLLYIPKIWQQREGHIPLFRGVSSVERRWQKNLVGTGFSIGWETNRFAWPMFYIDTAVVSSNKGTLSERSEDLLNTKDIYIAAGFGVESQTLMEVGLYFPFWVSHPIRGENNFALRMIMQWGFYF